MRDVGWYDVTPGLRLLEGGGNRTSRDLSIDCHGGVGRSAVQHDIFWIFVRVRHDCV